MTGLSGAGKSTIARLLASKFRAHRRSVVLLDGDQLRAALGHLLGFSRPEREQAARIYSRLCDLVSRSGVDVICPTMSMFDSVRDQNRATIARYFEVWVRAPLPVLRARSALQVYEQDQHVVGVDVAAEEPRTADFTIDNDGSETPDAIASRLWARLLEVERGWENR